MLRHEREILRREGAETLVEMLGGILDAQTVRRRLRRLNMPHARRLVLAVGRGRSGPADERAIVAALDERQLPHLLLRQRDEIVLLLPATLAATGVLTSQPDLTVGSSSAFTAGESLEIPRREAAWAASRAADAGRAHVTFEADDSSGRWLPQDVHALRALIDRTLGPVLRYDAEHGTELVPTVRAWLAADRRSDRVADLLHIHPNTLAYRLRRFAAISGLDPTSTADLAETWLAIRAGRTRRGRLTCSVSPPGPSGTLAVMSNGDPHVTVGAANPELNERLSRELDAFNNAASGDHSQRSLSVEARLDNGELIGGLTGWTWGTCAGVEMLWVDEPYRRDGWGARLMTAAEDEARARGCVQVLVSSFTFQAPDFYRRLGYVEFARSAGIPSAGQADVHFRKST